jgi:hypothetical protein
MDVSSGFKSHKKMTEFRQLDDNQACGLLQTDPACLSRQLQLRFSEDEIEAALPT